MYQGFYNLASGMLTQSRNLNVISNNMVNVQTAGYKTDTMVSTTFGDEMLYRTGRQSKETPRSWQPSPRSRQLTAPISITSREILRKPTASMTLR